MVEIKTKVLTIRFKYCVIIESISLRKYRVMIFRKEYVTIFRKYCVIIFQTAYCMLAAKEENKKKEK